MGKRKTDEVQERDEVLAAAIRQEEKRLEGEAFVARWEADMRRLEEVEDLPAFLAALKEMLPFWTTIRPDDPRAGVAARMAEAIRWQSGPLRAKYNQEHGAAIPPMPPGYFEMMTWAADTERMEAAGEQEDTPAAGKVKWDPDAPGYIANKDAIAKAQAVGRSHDIRELAGMDFSRIKKLLQSPRCPARFMSTREPQARGRVHQEDWQRYLDRQVDESRRIKAEVERQVTELDRP